MNVSRTDNFIASLGVEAYRVGGSVRDELLDRAVKDADYMIRGVRMNPLGRLLGEALKEAGFPKPSVRPLVLRDGRQAGWRVAARGLGCIEIVLPRTDIPRAPREGENTHRAFIIKIDSQVGLEEDSKRRDFTFNALYKRVEDVAGLSTLATIHDPTGRGLYDLEHKLVQTTHPDSFRDDPLRTLRALRFVSTLGYDLSASTFDQMRLHAVHVTGLSAKGYASGTVLNEMDRILMGDNAVKALRLARDTGVLAVLFPELKPMLGFDQGSRYHDLTTDEHTFKALETAIKVDAPLRVRWALLFHDSGKPATAWVGPDGRKHYYQQFKTLDRASVMHAPGTAQVNLDHEVVSERLWRAAAARLNATAKLRNEVATLVREHMVPIKVKNPATRVRRARVKFGDEMLRDLFMHRMCDISGKGTSSLPALENIAEMERLRQEAAESGVPAAVRDLQINGNDLKELGIEGRQIGVVLSQVLDEVVVRPDEENLTRERQIKRAEALA